MSDWSLARELTLIEASVPRNASFAEAARVLDDSGLAAIAVVDGDGGVIGLFTPDDLLGGIFVEYLEELRHTAFLEARVDVLLERAREVANEEVERHMSSATTVAVDTSSAHLAERFLHSEAGAIAVVDGTRFVGMISQLHFCRSLLRRVATDLR